MGWGDNNYKTIEITGGNDATNSELIAWLQANATQVIESQPFSVVKFNNLTLGRINNHYLSTFNGVSVLSGISAGSSPVITDLTGTSWVLNEVLDLSNYSDVNEGTLSEWEINFSSLYSDATVCNTLMVETWFDYINTFDIVDSVRYYDTNNGSQEVYSGGWVSNAARIIHITGGTDATNANLIAFLQENAVQKDLIHFLIPPNEHSFTAENGMTWEEYVNSIYGSNTGLTVSGNYMVAGGGRTLRYNNIPVLKTDTIISGATYSLGGGGSDN